MVMAIHTTFAHRLLIAGGFAVAVSAAPLVAALAAPAGPAAPALAQCPATEVLDPNTGACKPITDAGAAPQTTNPIEPGITGLAQIRGFRGETQEQEDLTQRLNSDIEYLEGWTLWRDFRIMIGTIRVLVHHKAF